MNKHIIPLIEQDFGDLLTIHKFNQYVPKLRDYFAPYVLEKMTSGITLDAVFIEQFNRESIIESAVYYIKNNENVSSKSAIDDFLIALNQLFERVILERYPNDTLGRLMPFSALAQEVDDRLKTYGIVLKEREAYPPIDQNQVSFMMKALELLNANNFKAMSVKIVVKLLLIYGLNVDRVASMLVSDYDCQRRILKLRYKDVANRTLFLELPYSLVEDFEKYLQLREEMRFEDTELLFVKTSGKPVRHDLAHEFLTEVKCAFEEETGEKVTGKNPFTLTGLQKFAIINMILEGMNPSVIISLTGLKEQVINDCQKEVDKISALNRNRYINQKIRGTKTFEILS